MRTPPVTGATGITNKVAGTYSGGPTRTVTRAPYYPAMLDLVNRRAVVIGGGKVASRKIDELLSSGAVVEVIAPKACTRIEALATVGALTLSSRSYREGDLANTHIAIVATSSSAVQERAWREAQALGIFVNTVDEPGRCTFITPSVLRRGSVTVAVSTSGRNPGLARCIRERLETQFPASFGKFVDLSALARSRLRECGVSYDDRSRFVAELFASQALALVEAGEVNAAHRLIYDLESKYVSRKQVSS